MAMLFAIHFTEFWARRNYSLSEKKQSEAEYSEPNNLMAFA